MEGSYEKVEKTVVGEWSFSLGLPDGANGLPEIFAINSRSGEALRYKPRQHSKVSDLHF